MRLQKIPGWVIWLYWMGEPLLCRLPRQTLQDILFDLSSHLYYLLQILFRTAFGAWWDLNSEVQP